MKQSSQSSYLKNIDRVKSLNAKSNLGRGSYLTLNISASKNFLEISNTMRFFKMLQTEYSAPNE